MGRRGGRRDGVQSDRAGQAWQSVVENGMVSPSLFFLSRAEWNCPEFGGLKKRNLL
jgi:hypothetical protein